MAGQIHKAGLVAQHAFDQFQCVEQRVLDLVEFAAFAAPERGRVEQDAVVAVAAFDFAGEEFVDVVDDPADRVVGEPVELGILACPLHHAFGGIDVAAMCAALGACQCGAAGVGKQVEEFERLFALGRSAARVLVIQLHISRVSGNTPRWPKSVVESLSVTSLIVALPGLRQFVAPAPLETFFASEKRVGRLPQLRLGWIPHGLRAGAIEGDLAKAFEFSAVATVEECVFVFHEEEYEGIKVVKV